MHLIPGIVAYGSGNVRLPYNPISPALPGVIFGADVYALPLPAEIQLDDLYGDHHSDGCGRIASYPALS